MRRNSRYGGYLLKLDIVPISDGIMLNTSFDERSRRARDSIVSESREASPKSCRSYVHSDVSFAISEATEPEMSFPWTCICSTNENVV